MEDLGEIPDPEAEAYANVGASTSLLDLAVGATANVVIPTSPPVLDVVATTNVGATTSRAIGLGQTTRHTLRSRSEVEVGHMPGVTQHQSPESSPPTQSTRIPVQEQMAHPSFEDPSVEANSAIKERLKLMQMMTASHGDNKKTYSSKQLR